MKTLQKALIVGALLGVSSPAIACDFHGGGMFWTPSGSWQNFHPKVNLVESIYLNEDDGEFALDDEFSTPIPPTTKARPSFSEAASRASRTAKFRITGNTIETVVTSETVNEGAEKDADDAKPETAELEADAQTIR